MNGIGAFGTQPSWLGRIGGISDIAAHPLGMANIGATGMNARFMNSAYQDVVRSLSNNNNNTIEQGIIRAIERATGNKMKDDRAVTEAINAITRIPLMRGVFGGTTQDLAYGAWSAVSNAGLYRGSEYNLTNISASSSRFGSSLAREFFDSDGLVRDHYKGIRGTADIGSITDYLARSGSISARDITDSDGQKAIQKIGNFAKTLAIINQVEQAPDMQTLLNNLKRFTGASNETVMASRYNQIRSVATAYGYDARQMLMQNAGAIQLGMHYGYDANTAGYLATSMHTQNMVAANESSFANSLLSGTGMRLSTMSASQRTSRDITVATGMLNERGSKERVAIRNFALRSGDPDLIRRASGTLSDRDVQEIKGIMKSRGFSVDDLIVGSVENTISELGALGPDGLAMQRAHFDEIHSKGQADSATLIRRGLRGKIDSSRVEAMISARRAASTKDFGAVNAAMRGAIEVSDLTPEQAALYNNLRSAGVTSSDLQFFDLEQDKLDQLSNTRRLGADAELSAEQILGIQETKGIKLNDIQKHAMNQSIMRALITGAKVQGATEDGSKSYDLSKRNQLDDFASLLGLDEAQKTALTKDGTLSEYTTMLDKLTGIEASLDGDVVTISRKEEELSAVENKKQSAEAGSTSDGVSQISIMSISDVAADKIAEKLAAQMN